MLIFTSSSARVCMRPSLIRSAVLLFWADVSSEAWGLSVRFSWPFLPQSFFLVSTVMGTQTPGFHGSYDEMSWLHERGGVNICCATLALWRSLNFVICISSLHSAKHHEVGMSLTFLWYHEILSNTGLKYKGRDSEIACRSIEQLLKQSKGSFLIMLSSLFGAHYFFFISKRFNNDIFVAVLLLFK